MFVLRRRPRTGDAVAARHASGRAAAGRPHAGQRAAGLRRAAELQAVVHASVVVRFRASRWPRGHREWWRLYKWKSRIKPAPTRNASAGNEGAATPRAACVVWFSAIRLGRGRRGAVSAPPPPGGCSAEDSRPRDALAVAGDAREARAAAEAADDQPTHSRRPERRRAGMYITGSSMAIWGTSTSLASLAGCDAGHPPARRARRASPAAVASVHQCSRRSLLALRQSPRGRQLHRDRRRRERAARHRAAAGDAAEADMIGAPRRALAAVRRAAAGPQRAARPQRPAGGGTGAAAPGAAVTAFAARADAGATAAALAPRRWRNLGGEIAKSCISSQRSAASVPRSGRSRRPPRRGNHNFQARA